MLPTLASAVQLYSYKSRTKIHYCCFCQRDFFYNVREFHLRSGRCGPYEGGIGRSLDERRFSRTPLFYFADPGGNTSTFPADSAASSRVFSNRFCSQKLWCMRDRCNHRDGRDASRASYKLG